MDEKEFSVLREHMLQVIALHAQHAASVTGRGRLDDRVMAAVGRVPRHEFVPKEIRPYAYVDSPLPIGHGKTISQPFIVALMTDLLQVEEGHSVLEIGTGLGYQAAILAELAGEIRSIEIIEALADDAKARLRRRGGRNVKVVCGDGARGWPNGGPFDRIIVTAAPELIPAPLLHQLKAGGRMVIPAGVESAQVLLLVEKNAAGHVAAREILPVRFSPLESDDDEDEMPNIRPS